MSRRSTILNAEMGWDSKQTETVEHRENAPQNAAADMSWRVIPPGPAAEASSLPAPDELERIYRASCKTASRLGTYRKLREMPAGEAAEVLRRKMGLVPIRGSEEHVSLPATSTSSLEQSSSPASSGSVASLGLGR